MRHLRRVAVAAMVATTMALAAATPAGAQPSPGASHPARTTSGSPAPDGTHRSPDGTRRSAEGTDHRQGQLQRLDARIRELSALTTEISKAERLTAAHRAALTALVSDTTAALTALRATLATADPQPGSTDQVVAALQAAALLRPQVRLTIAADLESAATTRLTAVADQLDRALATAAQAGTDTTAAQATLTDLRTHLTAAAAVGGQADALLALRPGAQHDTVNDQVAPFRTAVRTARDHLKAAHIDAKKIHTVLGEQHPRSSSPTPR